MPYLACMSKARPSRVREAHLDWLVITAASRAQAVAYRIEIDRRVREELLPKGCQIAIVPDAHDRRIGSGGATIAALAHLRNMFVQRGERGSLEQLFANKRILMLHSGGDSRRLPMYAVTGKLFATLPLPMPGFRCGTVFDLMLDDLLALRPRVGGEVLISAGDAVLGIARAPIRFGGEGIIGVAQRASEVRASRHGVFAREGRSRIVRAFLQKPTHDELIRADALARDGSALIDTGLMSFDPPAIAALLRGCGVAASANANARKDYADGSVLDGIMRGELAPIDLYRELMCALPRSTTREQYLALVAPSLRSVLAPLYEAMRATQFSVEIAKVDDFLHIGSMREMLDTLVGARAAIRHFGLHAPSYPLEAVATKGNGELVTLDCCVHSVFAGSGRMILDAVTSGKLHLGGENLITTLTFDAAAKAPHIPRGVCLFSVPWRNGTKEESIVIACGIDDDFKTPLDAGGTFMGQSYAALVQRAGLKGLVGDRSLWDQPLWCVAPKGNVLARVEWMWNALAAPAAWKNAKRVSMRQILDGVDPLALIARRDASLLAARVAAPDRAIDSLAQPIARARLAARLAAPHADSTIDPALRARAFREVGNAVLSLHELPREAQPAVILHDQAVWTSMPVRVDLAGGWSDTPPICNEVGGSVVNVAVMLRGQLPIQVVAKLVDEPVIRITSTDLGETRVMRCSEDLAQRHDPSRWSSLAENALVLTGAVPASAKESLPRWLKKVGGGISLTMFSAVPKGSGLGTSSILGAATIQCLDRVFGRERAPHELFAATSALEQMLSTRGGWQDQVGGVLGGFKIARSNAGAVQLPVAQRIDVSDALTRELSSRALLYFTGERRMAKNILEQVVWNWLRNEPSAIDAIEKLRSNAERMHDALAHGDIDEVIAQLNEYRLRKCQIDPGSCPLWLEQIGTRFKRDLSAWCFAGAGGGGFMLMIAKSVGHAHLLRRSIALERPHPRARVFDFEVDAVGLRCAVL